MGVSEILDVAIGLVLVWFLLSIAVSGINEAFSWLTRMRAQQLWRLLAGIVDSTVKPQARLRDVLWRIPVGVSDYRPEVSRTRRTPIRRAVRAPGEGGEHPDRRRGAGGDEGLPRAAA